MAAQTKPGWYPRPDMQDTLGFWDGQQWTEQTQPASATPSATANSRRTLAVIVAAVVALLAFAGWQVVTSDDDLQCATERAEAASEGRPAPDC